ncbi:MAG: translocation/assembly module TamB domain-containing protein [Longimicrobiales bacterium]
MPVDSLGAPEGGIESPARGRTVSFRRLRITDGTLEILLPAPPQGLSPETSLSEPSPDGTSTLRRLSFREIQLNVSEGVVLSPELDGERIEVESLSFLGEIRPAPFRVETLRGSLRRETGSLSATVEEVRMPSSDARGTVEVGWGGPEGVRVSVEGESEALALQDLRWIEPRLPAGVVSGPFGLEMRSGGLLLNFRGTRLTLSQGSLQARGGLLLGTPLRLEDLDLALDDIDLAILDPWLSEPLPLRGLAEGDILLNGDPSSLAVSANLDLSGSDSTMTTSAEVSGVFHLGDPLGVTDLFGTVAPLEWGIFGAFSPSMTLRGPGALRFEANGLLPQGINVNAEATHVPSGMAPSRVTASGTVQGTRDGLLLSLSGELSPLSFTSLRRYFEALPLTGEVSGPVALRGYLSDLTVEAELLTPAGPLGLVASFDARNPADGYSIDSEFQEFLLSNLLPEIPQPTRLTGRILASGRGTTWDDLEGDATLFLRRGEVGALRVDTAALVARVEQGRLGLDTLMAETNLGRLGAGGEFGISSSSAPGDLSVEVESQSLEGLRPFLMGDVPLILDELNQFERDLLTLEGVELDTIPTAEEVAMDGRLQGRAVFSGRLDRFSGEGTVSVQDLRYRTDYLRGGTLTFSARDLPGEARRIQGLFRADSLRIRDLSLRGGEVEGEVGKADGRMSVIADRREGEEYRARGTFALDSLGGRVNLDELDLRFDTLRWNLGGPTSFAWGPDGVEVTDFRLIRPGIGRMRVQADGVLPFRGEGDFNLVVEGLHLDRLARLVQMDAPMEGVLDLRLRIGGTAEDPTMEGSLAGESLRYDEFTLAGLDSEFTYRNQRLEGEAWASEGGRQVLAVEGSMPLDLRLRPEGSRIPREPIDLTMAVDSFPVALVLVVVEAMEEVQGELSGQLRLRGTPDALAPVGGLHLGGGSVLLPALGIRFTEAEAAFALNPDGTVGVTGSLRSVGTGRVNGTVNLHPLTDPRLDLTVSADNLLAVQRRDVQAHVTGEVQVLQTYRRPRVQGSLTVEQGVLMVEELARTAEVVDLSDPLFMDVLEEETTLRPVVRASQNPFLQNLMLAVDLSMSRDGWLRGKDLNVEMDGDLQVFWDRAQRDLAMVGELEAVRGYYTVLGRQFQVRSGGVRFVGTPGVNPNLDIEAYYRLRTGDGDQWDIIANVGGTLLTPRVSLTSNAAFGIAESDLVSYLIFGRPAYALASAQNQYVQGAAGSLLGAAGGATLNLGLGAVGSQLGSVVARDSPVDFLAIRQGSYVDPFAGAFGWNTVSTTQVEIGQYLTPDLFAALMWRPFTSLGASAQSEFAGLRLEWRLQNFWTLEAFVEDRFSRSPLFNTGNLGYQVDKILGFSFWREWGY